MLAKVGQDDDGLQPQCSKGGCRASYQASVQVLPLHHLIAGLPLAAGRHSEDDKKEKTPTT